MGNGTAFLLSVVLTGVFLYGLYFVVRAGVAAGIRQALPDAALRPTAESPYEGTTRGPDGAQV